VADDDPGVRRVLSDCLKSRGYEPLAAADGEQALSLAAAHSLHLALIDVRMPGPSGMTLAARLREMHPGLDVIIITAYGTVQGAVEAMRAGAFDYLEKPLRPKQVLAVVKEALAARRSSEGASPGPLSPQACACVERLTPRQTQVLRSLGQGMTNREIAAELSISTKTVDHHVRALLSKLEVANRTQAALIAQRDALANGESVISEDQVPP
jgi:DNA-binding NarL/FixJ family response regulator